MVKIKAHIEQIKELLADIESEHIQYDDCMYVGIDTNAYAYWLCYTDSNGSLEDLLNNIQLYGGIK